MENSNNLVSISHLFMPINSTNIIIDCYGNSWKQITSTGYQRVFDKFFWPFDPRDNENMLGEYPPSISEVEKVRNK